MSARIFFNFMYNLHSCFDVIFYFLCIILSMIKLCRYSGTLKICFIPIITEARCNNVDT